MLEFLFALECHLKKCSNKILHIETEELNKLKLKDNQIKIQCIHIIPGRIVEIYAVEIIKLQSLQHVINCFRCSSFAVFTRPQFASDPYFFTGNSTVNDSLSHTGFVEISMCRRYPDYSAATTASCEVSFKSFRPLLLLSCSNRWIWVPRPSCGTCTPLLRVIRGTSTTEEMLDTLDVPKLGISGVLVSVSWFFCESSLCPESVWDIADVF